MKKFIKVLFVLLTLILLTNAVIATDSDVTTPEEPVITEPTEPAEPIETPPAEETQQTPQEPTQTQTPTPTNSNNNTNYYTKQKSTNNYLQSLTADQEGLTPEFNKETDTYYITIPLTVNNITLNATPEDENSKIVITGNTNLRNGENVITIRVTSESGNWRIYRINVTKINEESLANANLKELKINGYEIKFNPNKYEYSIKLLNNENKLDITAVADNEKAKIVIDGNENLDKENSSITINVTAEDETTQREYKINIIRQTSDVEVKETEPKTKLIILSICFALFLLCFIVFINKVSKK